MSLLIVKTVGGSAGAELDGWAAADRPRRTDFLQNRYHAVVDGGVRRVCGGHGGATRYRSCSCPHRLSVRLLCGFCR